jgi:hypothetical protein
MRKIRTTKEVLTSSVRKSPNQLYCTINNVLTPVVFSKTQYDNNQYYEYVNITHRKRLKKQKSLKTVRSTSVPVKEGALTINPLFSFYYDGGLKEVESGNNLKTWASSIGTNQLTMPVTATQPDIGLKGNGIAGVSPIYFNYDNSDYMIFSSGVTLTGDFTIFMYVEPIPLVANVHKYHRFLGKSDDNDMYFSIGEFGSRSYTISFSSSSSVSVSSLPYEYWQPSSKKILITLQRSGSTMYIRENGVQVATDTMPTTDFSFNQFGIRGGLLSDTYNGSLYHLSAYDGYISNDLKSIENSIIKKASLAKG